MHMHMHMQLLLSDHLELGVSRQVQQVLPLLLSGFQKFAKLFPKFHLCTTAQLCVKIPLR